MTEGAQIWWCIVRLVVRHVGGLAVAAYIVNTLWGRRLRKTLLKGVPR
jgi:hypothetical protein